MNESCIKRVNVSSLLLYCIAGFTSSSRTIITSQAHSLYLGEKKNYKRIFPDSTINEKGGRIIASDVGKAALDHFMRGVLCAPPHTHTHQINHLFPSTELFLANLSCSQYNCDS